jgi:hypothetical protein
MWGNFKSDKWKKKTILLIELEDIDRDLYHPAIRKSEIIEIREYIKNKVYTDAHEQPFKPLTRKQTRDWYSMNHYDFMEKWKDKL